MGDKSFIEQSKINWKPAGDKEVTHEQIMIGCLQRIATASETMAKKNQDLEADRDWYKNRYYEQKADNQTLRNTNRSLKSWVTRWKNKANS